MDGSRIILGEDFVYQALTKLLSIHYFNIQ